uniref:Uncharacterized protein n=1 Tax=Plectus sambesii TaxID=2011161 RepID=A0A914W6T0_9BILA
MDVAQKRQIFPSEIAPRKTSKRMRCDTIQKANCAPLLTPQVAETRPTRVEVQVIPQEQLGQEQQLIQQLIQQLQQQIQQQQQQFQQQFQHQQQQFQQLIQQLIQQLQQQIQQQQQQFQQQIQDQQQLIQDQQQLIQQQIQDQQQQINQIRQNPDFSNSNYQRQVVGERGGAQGVGYQVQQQQQQLPQPEQLFKTNQQAAMLLFNMKTEY